MIDDPELPITGITPVGENDARFCVWAPKAERVDLVLGPSGAGQVHRMEPLRRGYFERVLARPGVGTRYAYRLDGGPPLPDPGSRWQPEGALAPSAYWSPDSFRWNDRHWQGHDRGDLVFYELHVGTFTSEGTFAAVIPRIDDLLELGVTAIELMPVGQFPGTRSWGYDGVHPFAPQNSYGGPEGLERLVDACHVRGMAVYLDVVYNHLGPLGNVFPAFGHYFTDRYRTDWGHALNFDGRGCDAVRALVLDNARQWIRDFHIDGLRLDAADQIYDGSPRHILSEVAEVVHREADRQGRRAYVFAETDLNDAPRFLGSRDHGGYGLDGHWNDDFHHAAHVVLTGDSSGYFEDFAHGPRALAKALSRVFVNDGNYSPFRGRRHGTVATEFPGGRFVAFTQNHDQVGNRPGSARNAAMLAPSATRLAAGMLLLAPRLPLLFMGEEYGETAPFPFFCDYSDPAVVRAVREGRAKEFAYFGGDVEVPDPVAAATRESAVLSWSWESPLRRGLRALYRDLLRLRRDLPALRDDSHAETRLVSADHVLEVARGHGQGPGGRVRIVLNLTAEEQTLLNPAPVLFRSEIETYGASASAGRDAQILRAHEFVVLDAGG